MFVMITGIPGSGKSYYAVDYILKNQDRYHKIYTNINGFDLDGNIESLNFRKIYDIVVECQQIYDSQIAALDDSENNDIDSPIIDYLLDIGFLVKNDAYDPDDPKSGSQFLPTLLVIDECQNHFPVAKKKADDTLVWFISYHRHLFIDALLLTQNFQQVDVAYRRNIEYFLHAVESSLSILGNFSPTFSYKQYMKTPFYKSNLAKTIKIKKSKKVFDRYKSGDKVRTKSVVLPWLIFSVFALILVLYIIYYVQDKFSHSDPDTNSSIPVHSVSTTPHKSTRHTSPRSYSDIDADFTGKRYLHLFCISTRCKNPDKSIKLNIDHLPQLLKATDSQYLSSIKTGKDMADVYLLVTADFINLFKERTHDKKNSGFSLIH